MRRRRGRCSSESDFNEEIYASFYGPKTGADGVWELPLVLETVSEASGTTILLPLPYRRLNAEVLEYLEDVAQLVPKDKEARIVVYLPMEHLTESELLIKIAYNTQL